MTTATINQYVSAIEKYVQAQSVLNRCVTMVERLEEITNYCKKENIRDTFGRMNALRVSEKYKREINSMKKDFESAADDLVDACKDMVKLKLPVDVSLFLEAIDNQSFEHRNS